MKLVEHLRRWQPFCCVVLLSAAADTALAAPEIKQLSLRGLQAGAATTLVIDGADLSVDTRIVLPVPIARQEVKPTAKAERIEIEITLEAGVTPDIYPLRVANNHGISGAMLVGVDKLAQRPFAADAGPLPVALTGALSGGMIQRTSFEGKAGQKIVIDVESHRLASNLNPVVHLFDAKNSQLAWSQMIPSIAGDARITTTLPADGRYTVELHDALYRGAEPGVFRLKIGEFQYADLVFPLGALRGSQQSYELAGTNLTPNQNVSIHLDGASASAPVLWPTEQVLSGNRPRVVLGDLPEVREQDGGANLQPVKLPVAIDGRLLAAKEEDRYLVDVTPGQTLRFDVLAARAGSPLDGVLTLRKESGEQLAAADDGASTTDPTLDFKVPEGVSKIVVAVKDLLARGGSDFAYRISIAPVDRPDFALEIFGDREHVPDHGAEIVRVRAARSGYQGPIKIALSGLPAGITVNNDEIPAGATDALVTLTAAGAPAQAVATVSGASMEGNLGLVRQAMMAGSSATKYQPWLRGDVAVAVTGSGPLAVAWEADSAGAQLPLGSRLPARVKVTRAPLAGGAVRLSLVTSQIPPQKEEPAPNNQKKRVDDVERTLRFDGAPVIPADQSEITAAVLVPADLANIPYDLAIRAELLAADGKQVVARAITPARRLTTIQPLRIELAGEPKVEAKAGTGETGKIVGKVARLSDFPHPVTVTLTGLPADYLAPSVVVPADASDFSLPVVLPFNSPNGPLAGVSVVATAQAGGAAVRSNEIPITVDVVAGGPPPALYPVFEDEAHFVSLLNEGGGKASLDTTDRLVGAAALRVTPDQKFRVKLPGLGVKIAEQPGAGEYRYLRYAWKKIGGGNVLLQLNAGGQWGPMRGAGKPGYRYEAGPAGNPFNAEAIRTSDRLPYGWVIVTRDLFADFGAFQLDGLAFTPGDGEAALFDHIYLARTPDDFAACPPPVPAEAPLALFEDQPEFVAALDQGAGTAALVSDDKLSGAASVKVTPEQRYNPALPGLGVKIRQNPGPGEYRYLQFAWKKHGGERICLQLNHDGQWGPVPSTNPLKFRYDAGPAAGDAYGGALRVDGKLPSDWVVVTRDLFADLGEFIFTGLSLAPVDGEFALFDHIYLGRTPRDFDAAAQ